MIVEEMMGMEVFQGEEAYQANLERAAEKDSLQTLVLTSLHLHMKLLLAPQP